VVFGFILHSKLHFKIAFFYEPNRKGHSSIMNPYQRRVTCLLKRKKQPKRKQQQKRKNAAVAASSKA